MATNTLNILKPSVNNMTTRIFVRAAGLEYLPIGRAATAGGETSR